MREAWSNHRGKALVAAWVCLNLGAALVSSPAAEISRLSASATNQNVRQQRPISVRLSPALAAILRMVRAGFDPEVVNAYIKTANVPFNPTAGEIVTLTRLGVPEDLITSILVRDGELRARLAAQPPSNPASSVPRSLSLGYNNTPPLYQTPSPMPLNPGVPNYSFYHPPRFIPAGQVVSFNNSFPTFVNGQPVYAGYYFLPYLW